MTVPIRREEDRGLLDTLIAGGKDAVQRDRLRAARAALDGEQAQEIAGMLGRSRRFTGASSALIAQTVNTHFMNEHLRFIGAEAGPDAHVVLVLDKAGWHVAKALKVPENVTLLHLPPYSPELNGSERIGGYLWSHYLSHRVFKDYEDLFQSITRAWNSLDAHRLKSLIRMEWIEHAA